MHILEYRRTETYTVALRFRVFRSLSYRILPWRCQLPENTAVDQVQLNWITGYIWGIADDVLRDLYVRGKYRDVILPMTVLRRLDAVLEDSKQSVLDMKETPSTSQNTESPMPRSRTASWHPLRWIFQSPGDQQR
jgi:HsdM N-terminal domain